MQFKFIGGRCQISIMKVLKFTLNFVFSISTSSLNMAALFGNEKKEGSESLIYKPTRNPKSKSAYETKEQKKCQKEITIEDKKLQMNKSTEEQRQHCTNPSLLFAEVAHCYRM